MGSTGSGHFSDYQGYSGTDPKQGGEIKDNICEKAFRTELEDVETSQYFRLNGILPPVDSMLTIGFSGVRIVALIDNLEIGNLPTKFNYLRKCMVEYSYTGIITNTSNTPINSIHINVTPNA